MIIALSACVGVSIMVSRCKRHRLVGKWWFLHGSVVVAGNSQSAVSRMFCGVGQWKWMPRLPPHPHVCLFSIWGASMFNWKRDVGFFFTKGEHVSLTFALVLKCLILELCTQVLPRSWEETRATDFKTSYMRSSLWLSRDASMVATVYAQSGGRSGKPFHRFCVSVRHSEPYII